MRWTVLGLVAAALSACGGGDEDAAAVDANAAGFVPPAVTSRLDWGSRQERRFNTLDRNVDGKLTRDEFPRANARIGQYDANGDGDITKIEWSEGVMARFDRMDLNKDGTVTSEERETTRDGAVSGR